MTLQLLICTFNDGIKRIPDLLLPPIDGVEYLVSWQQADDFTPTNYRKKSPTAPMWK